MDKMTIDTAHERLKDPMWNGFTQDQKEALLALSYHSLDETDSGFESKHAKTILGLLLEMETEAKRHRPAATFIHS